MGSWAYSTLRFQVYMAAFSVLLGCSGMRTAPFRGGSDYHSQSQGFEGPSSSTRDNHYPGTRGPFELTWPVKRVKINRGFIRAKRPHQGIDFGGQRGDEILAAHEGYVIYTGNGFRGYGKMVIIQYNDIWATLYAHLNRITVQEGDYLSKGEVIGKMGRTGRATGVHLHFELMRKKLPIDPMPLLNKDTQLVKR
jgi:murein DD-endopeptidase MepM/ murein hydrolase activator NlpD